jgi:hypothetical protein
MAGAVPGGVQPPGELIVAGDRSESPDELDRCGRGALGRAGMDGTVSNEFVGGAGVPADPDPYLAVVRFGQQGDVGDQGAQQPLAVPGAGGRRLPQSGQIGGEFLQLGPAGQRWQLLLDCGRCLLGLGERGELGLPAGFEGAGD